MAEGCDGSNLATPSVPLFLWSNAKSMCKFTLLPTQICFLLAPSVYLYFRKPGVYFSSWYSSSACFSVWQEPFHREVTPLHQFWDLFCLTSSSQANGMSRS